MSWSNSMKPCVAIIQVNEPWRITLTRKGNIGPLWNKILKTMSKDVISVKDTLSFPVYLLKLSIQSQVLGRLHSGDRHSHLPIAVAQKIFLLVVIDYFSRWMKVDVYASIKIRMSLSSFGKTSCIDSEFHKQLWQTMGHNLTVSSFEHSAWN